MPPLTLLGVEPDSRIEFPKDGGNGGGVRLRLTNTSATLVAFKVKSTARTSYHIKPSTGSIRRGEALEVQLVRRPPEEVAEGEAADAPKGKRPDRFLVQAAVVDTDEKKLLLHAANRGKGQGAAKFWDGVPKEELEERQLEVTLVDAYDSPDTGKAGKPDKPDKGKGGKGAAQGVPSDADIDAIIGKVSLPGRANVGAGAEGGKGAPPGFGSAGDAAAEVTLVRSGSPGQRSFADEPPAARQAPATALKKPAQRRREDIVLQKHSRPVTFVACNPNGKELYTCGKDKLVFAWSVPEGEFVRQYEGHRGAVWACSVTHDGILLLTCGADSMVLLWEVASAQQLAEVQLPGVARCVDWAPSGERSHVGRRHFAACSNNFKDRPAALSVWDTHDLDSEPRQLFTIKELPSPATQIAWAGVGCENLCSVHPMGSTTGEVLFWHGSSGELLGRLEAHQGPTSQVAFSTDRCLMASCGRVDMYVRLWDLSGGLKDGQPACLQSYQGDRPLNAVGLRSALTREEVQAVGESTGPISCDVLAGGGQDAREVALVGAGTDDQFDPVPMRLGAAESLESYAPGGSDLKGGGHFGPIHAVCFSVDGALCISGAEDGNVRIRDLLLLAAQAAAASPRPSPRQAPAAPPQVAPADVPPLASVAPTQPPAQPPPPPPSTLSTALSALPHPKAQQQQQQQQQQPQPQPAKAKEPKAQPKTQPKAQPKAKDGQAKVELATQISPGSAKAKQPPMSPPQMSLMPDAPPNRLIAIYDFDPLSTGWPFGPQYRPLPFSKGQEIEVLREFGANWSYGHLAGNQALAGLFPMNYVMPMAKYQEMMMHRQIIAASKAKAASPQPSPVAKPMPSPTLKPEIPSLLQQDAARPPFGLGMGLGLGLSGGLSGGVSGGLSGGLSSGPALGLTAGLTGGLTPGLAGSLGSISGGLGSGLTADSLQNPANEDEDGEGCSQS